MIGAVGIVVTLATVGVLWRVTRRLTTRCVSLAAIFLLAAGTPIALGLGGQWGARETVSLLVGTLALTLFEAHRGRHGIATRLALAALAGVAGGAGLPGLGLLALAVWPADGRGRRTTRRATLEAGGLVGLALAVLAITRAACGAGPPAVDAAPGVALWNLAAALFRSNGGLLYATPLTWVGLTGCLLGARRGGRYAWPLCASWGLAGALAAVTPWWTAGFEALLPLLAIGLVDAIEYGVLLARRRPLLPLVGALGALVMWNFLFMEQYRRNWIPRDDTVALSAVAENDARLLSEAAAMTPAWPASWLMGRLYGLSAASVESLLGARIPFDEAGSFSFGLGEREGPAGLLLEGWSSPRVRGGLYARRVQSDATLALPLTRLESSALVVVAAGRGTLSLAANGQPIVRVPLTDDFIEYRVPGRSIPWRRPVSVFTFSTDTGGEAWVAEILTRREGMR
jgi:hypothetical protein